MFMIRIKRIDVRNNNEIDLWNMIDFGFWSTIQNINTFDLTLF